MEQNKEMKSLRSKITDYTHFGYVLLALSVFLYIGVIIPEDRSPFQLYTLMGSTAILLSLSLLFFILAMKSRKQLDE
ncbi:YrhC family protein [Ferdinandcohnia sp. Marseille-Q9671]